MTEQSAPKITGIADAVASGAKAVAFLAAAFAFLQIGLHVPTVSKVADDHLKMSSLQTRQLEKLLADGEKVSAAINDGMLIYAARTAGAERAIPMKNADQIVDAATDRLAARFGKEWEVIIRGMAAKLETRR